MGWMLSECEKTSANTYVVYTDPTNINLDEITSTVAEGYTRSSSLVKLRLLMVMVFVFDQQPEATFNCSDQQASNESFENQKKSEDQFYCFPQPVFDWQYYLQKKLKAIKKQLDMIYKINPIIVGVSCKNDSNVSGQLIEIVWQRSLSLDEQMLSFYN